MPYEYEAGGSHDASPGFQPATSSWLTAGTRSGFEVVPSSPSPAAAMPAPAPQAEKENAAKPDPPKATMRRRGSVVDSMTGRTKTCWVETKPAAAAATPARSSAWPAEDGASAADHREATAARQSERRRVLERARRLDSGDGTAKNSERTKALVARHEARTRQSASERLTAATARPHLVAPPASSFVPTLVASAPGGGMSRAGNVAQRSAAWATARRGDAARKREAHLEAEMASCTFAPKTQPRRPGATQGGSIYERGTAWNQDVQSRRQKAAAQVARDADAECTFAPQTTGRRAERRRGAAPASARLAPRTAAQQQQQQQQQQRAGGTPLRSIDWSSADTQADGGGGGGEGGAVQLDIANLPPGWLAFVDSRRRVYYFDAVSGKTAWELPESEVRRTGELFE